MSSEEVSLFAKSIIPIILDAGELAIKFQNGIVNIGKNIQFEDSEPERVRKRDQAKTEIDEKVQEILLNAIKNIHGTKDIIIDAEEDTPTKKDFNKHEASLTAVIDPIDGTLEYVNGSDKYSINLGLIESGKILLAIIYFPKTKQMYYLDYENIPYLLTYSENLEQKSKKEILKIKNEQRLIYTNNRVPTETINKLKGNGFKVIVDDGKVLWPDALIKCMSGEYFASIFHSPQTRDVLLGALIENLPSGYMIDWKGNKCAWPDGGGRISEVVFGTGDLPIEIIKSLNE